MYVYVYWEMVPCFIHLYNTCLIDTSCKYECLIDTSCKYECLVDTSCKYECLIDTSCKYEIGRAHV